MGQSAPSCASDDDKFLVSFHSYRCDTTYGDIFAARINANGEVIDTNGFLVCMASGDQRKSKVAYADGNFLVLWEDERNFDSTGFDIYGSRITSSGVNLDPDGKRITSLSYQELTPNLSWDGENFFVIWEEGNFGENWDISGAFIDTSGTRLDPNSLIVSTACEAQLFGKSSWSGSSYLAIWEENGDLHAKRVDPLGNLLDSASIPVCSASDDQKLPSVAWGKESFLTVWEDFRNLNFDIYGARIDSVGGVLDLSSLPIRVDSATEQRHPSVASDGENYLVIWTEILDSTGETYEIEGVRVSPEGEVLDPQPFSISSGDRESLPAVAFGGGKYLAVWLHDNTFDIYGALVDTSGMVMGSTIEIGVAAGIQTNPQVASDGTDFLVVWEDYGTHWPNIDITGTRVTAEGAVLDPWGLFISAAQDPEEQPSVSFDGTNYVVVWKRTTSDSSELRLSRVTPDGEVLDLDGIFISDISPYSSTSIAFGPTGQSLLLYSKYQTDPYNSPRIFGAFFWGEPEPNQPPNPFSLLSPEDQDTVIRPVFLDWEEASDPNPSDQVTYTLYVSTSDQFIPESTLVIDSLTASQSSVSLEEDGIIYWWKVRAQDRWGEVRWSNEIWSFDLENYGDANGDGQINASDVVFLINYLFIGGPPPQPLSAGDINGDCLVNSADVVYLINYLFAGGPIPEPGCA
ncbi:MAG: dockerin type I repeat-containing protein [Candidatus Zixiibacteriota bacterium]